jgi:uncharacterized protein (UPF0332 family)
MTRCCENATLHQWTWREISQAAGVNRAGGLDSVGPNPPSEAGVVLARAQEFLQLAELALANELYNGCAVCCYAALFWAAIAALEHQGFTQREWSHGGLKQTFTHELIQRRHLYPKAFGTWLVDAYDLRTLAQYKPKDVGTKETRRLLHHTRAFVMTVEEVVTP